MPSASQIAGSLNQLDETTSFFAFLYKFTKIESCSKSFWLGMVKIRIWSICSLHSKSTMYLKNKQMELPDFLHAGINSRKLKANWKCLGWAK